MGGALLLIGAAQFPGTAQKGIEVADLRRMYSRSRRLRWPLAVPLVLLLLAFSFAAPAAIPAAVAFPGQADTDGDGVPDNQDRDDDNDGITDFDELSRQAVLINPTSKPSTRHRRRPRLVALRLERSSLPTR